MEKYKSTIIVIDTEYITIQKNKLDILEIGAVAINEECEIEDEFFVKCKPTRYEYEEIGSINKLLCMSKEYYYSGMKYEHALKKFLRWMRQFKSPVLCTWSDSEISIFKNRIEYILYKNKANNVIKMFDLQKYYMKINELNELPSLKNVLIDNCIGLNNDMKLHNALNDARYTAAIYIKYSDTFIEILQDKNNNKERLINKKKIYYTNEFNSNDLIKELNNCVGKYDDISCSLLLNNIETKYNIGRATINAYIQGLVREDIVEVYRYKNSRGKCCDGLRFKQMK